MNQTLQEICNLQIKISVAPDPEKYLDQIIEIYNKLKEGRKLPGEILVMAAITICDQSNGKDVDAVITKVKESYVSSAVSSVIAEEVILTLIMIIVITTNMNFIVISS